MNRILSSIAIILLATAPALADSAAAFVSVRGDTYFRCNELSMDVFGTLRTHGDLGLGLGANYFLTEFFGAGIDTRFEQVDWPNHINASLIARYPIEKWRLAPYGFGGGGRQYRDGSQWQGHIGGGLDYRFTPHMALFTDVRETFPERSSDFTLWRFGVRIVF